MSSENMSIAASFASWYYTTLLQSPETALEAYLNQAKVFRGSEKPLHGHDEIRTSLHGVQPGQRIVVTDIEACQAHQQHTTIHQPQQHARFIPNIAFVVTGRYTAKALSEATIAAKKKSELAGAEAALEEIRQSTFFRQHFELKPFGNHQHTNTRRNFAVFYDSYWRYDEMKEQAVAAAEAAVSAAPKPRPAMTSWSAETPPMFAAKAELEVEPLEESELVAAAEPVPQSEEELVTPQTCTTAAPAEEPAFPDAAEEEEVPAATVEEPTATPVAEAVNESEVEETPAIEAAPEAAVEEAASSTPAAKKSFADMLRGNRPTAPSKVAPKLEAKPAAPVEAPAAEKKEKKEKSTEEKKPKAAEEKKPKAAEAPKVAEKPKTAGKPKAEEPKAEAVKAVVATEVTKPVEDKKPVAAATANMWKKGGTSFATLAAAAPAPAAVATPLAVRASTKAVAPAAAPARETADEKPTRRAAASTEEGATRKRASRKAEAPASVSHYHVFLRGLPEGTSEQDIIDAFAPDVVLRPGIKIESKQPADGTPAMRTFAFANFDKIKKADVPKKVAEMKAKRVKIGGCTVVCDEVREKGDFAKKAAPAA